MSHRDEPYIDPRSAPPERGAAPERGPTPSKQADDPWPDRDERWTEERQEPTTKRKGSLFGRILTIVLVVLVVLVALAGGGYLAISQGWIDASRLGIPIGTPSRPQSADAEIIFSGNAGDLTAAEGNIVQEDTSVSPAVVWLRSSVQAASPAGATGGISLQIPESLLPRMEGRAVRVTLSARTGGRAEPSPFAVAYSAGSRGNSGWIVFVPSQTMDTYSFNYRVPIGEVSDPDNRHYIGIWSDISGGNAPLAVDRITIEPL